LNLPRWGLGRCNEAGITDQLAIRVKNVSVIERWRKIGVIDDVKKFRSKLHVESIGNSLDVIVLEDREIQIHQPRSNKRVAAKVSAKSVFSNVTIASATMRM
jgi:hypothetical protein